MPEIPFHPRNYTVGRSDRVEQVRGIEANIYEAPTMHPNRQVLTSAYANPHKYGRREE